MTIQKKTRGKKSCGSKKRGGTKKRQTNLKCSKCGRKRVGGKCKCKKGGSPGLDKLGYGWNGSDTKTWPGVKSNKNSITRSNHLRVSPYGVPVGGVNLPYSTYGDKTGNSSKPVPKCALKLIGGYTYGPGSSKKKSAKKLSTRNKKSIKRNKNPQSGGFFFEDVKNFGRYLANGVKTRVNGVRGIQAPNGVMPTDQPYINKDVNVIISDPVDVETLYLKNSKDVASI